ncbi:MAG: protein kinase domain-containing protein [Gemmataceae bacterium]
MTQAAPDVKSIFGRALEIESPAARTVYLDEACGTNAGLRAEVEGLLATLGRAGEFMRRPAAAVAMGLNSGYEPVSEGPGTVIGPYKLLQQIGEGGMGTVFMAEQTEPVRRMVALKLIKEGLDSRQIIARFDAERQALALMDHPNIAKVLDAGTIGGEPGRVSAGGPPSAYTAGLARPYFVMELVKGVPITKYCDDHHLTPRQRLELFIPVCQAVQHAHQKGIIHRDLKPSNVLVAQYDGKPVPKVIDFGVAKAAGPKLTDRTLFTELGAVVGTFEYMSPEQAELNQLDVDTRSDIYSLGVLLYELLTGTTPLERGRVKQAALLEVLRLIREEEPPRPSLRLSDLGRSGFPSHADPVTVPALKVMPTSSLVSISALRHTEPAKLTKLMRGELDWIVMKALEKDRNRRYETANGFAMDVQRYLADEQVQACPPSALYRFRKFARRNKAAFAVVLGVILAVLLGVAGLAISNVRISQEKDLKQQALQQAETNEVVANAQRTIAQDNEQKAEAEKKRAIQQEAIAKEQELLARRRFYASQMNLAMQAWEAGQPARVLELLESQRPRLDEEDLRAFEWYYLWRLCQGKHKFSLPTQKVDNARALAYSPDGKTLASGCNETVKIWDVTTGQELREFRGHPGSIGCLAYAADGKTLAVGAGGKVKLWDLVTSKERANIAPNQFVEWVAFTGDSSKLVMGGAGVKVWDLTLGREEASLRGKDGEKFDMVAVAPDGKAVAAGSDAGIVRIWTRDGAVWRDGVVITGLHWNPPVAISPNGKDLAIAGNTLKLYDLATGKERIELHGHIGTIYSITFAGDGKTLVSAGHDRTVRVWDAATGQERNCLAHSGPVYAVAAAPDGTTLAAMTTETVWVWDVASPEEQAVLRHTGFVRRVVFSPDGKSLVSSGSGAWKTWDLASRQEISSLPAADIKHTCLAFSPDGKKLVTSGLSSGSIEV